MNQILKSLTLSIFTMAILFILSRQYGQIPPLGIFFDQILGFWRSAWQDDSPDHQQLCIKEVKNKTETVFDCRGVPPIFGDNELDIFTAIGYVHAWDRLWQMDIKYRFASGSLSEITGKQALNHHIEQQKLGLLTTAKLITASLDSYLVEYKILQAYANGVNHFINNLSFQNYPFEFKLLNYAQESWAIEKTVMVNVMMGYLSRSIEDIYFSQLQQIFSRQKLEELFPAFYPIAHPIIPENGKIELLKNVTLDESISFVSFLKDSLNKQHQLDLKDMMRFQNDVYAVRAAVFVLFIIQAYEKHTDSTKSTSIDSMLNCLKNWNHEMQKQEVVTTIFDCFMNTFITNTWKDYFPEGSLLWPGELIIERLTKNEPSSKWFDDITTPGNKDRDKIIRKSFIITKDQLSAELGSTINNWKWERYHQSMIAHQTRSKPLGVDPFPNNGGFGTLNVGNGKINSFGPSWRMIVSSEQPIHARGVYPGGQSDNPSSKHYIDFLETWKNEQYFEIIGLWQAMVLAGIFGRFTIKRSWQAFLV